LQFSPFRPWVWAGLLGALLIAGCGTDQDGPRPAVQSISADGRLNLGKSDRCPVCAMFPYRYPQTAAGMTLKNNTTFYFCSNGCLLRSWLRPTVYLGRHRSAIDRLVARDYFCGAPVDGCAALWVAGSDVIGPMGPAIVALGYANQLEAFRKRHGGSAVFTLDELDDNLWRRIHKAEQPETKPE
jgi:nitrous oxide reductase accessory protein NosL